MGDLIDLRGKTAVVTGAGSGIGRACALRFAQCGASLIAADLNIDAAGATVAQAKPLGAPATAIAIDVRDPAQCEGLADTAVSTYGGIDIVLNAAGIFPPAPIFDMTIDQWDNMIDINTRGTFLVSRACATRMANGGAIVNLASKSALIPTIGMSHYAASKGAVVMLTKAMALEFADRRIRVNAVAPGAVDTEGAMSAAAQFAENHAVDLGDIKKAYTSRNPIGRECEPDEIARVALFLATPLSSYVNGETILVDGGHLLT